MMKQAFYEVPMFIAVILIALIIMGKDFNKTSGIYPSSITTNEISTCIDVNKCISQSHLSDERKNKSNLLKEIKTFLRQKIY
ncbi:TPA: hypothetical protein RG647_RS09465 [Providencia rettgeri]|uniref:hypothetical protein n=1 Tax=Providencia sp. PROV129 TaxID=2949839 RepID=UPI00234B0338|nr:hypothetical protein [Providencia sp. PROV129]HEC8328590.1 hypothetical protein [Providencia rettgeri]